MGWSDYITGITPSWLSKPAARGFLSSFGQVGDSLQSDAVDAANYGLIEECATDGLNPHLRNSNLPVIAGEDPALTRSILRRRWEIWEQSGSVAAIVDGLDRLGIKNAQVVSQLDLFLAGNVGAFGGVQGLFAVLLPFPNPFADPFLWRDGGIRWRADQRLWGLGGGPESAQLLGDAIRVIRKFKPAPTSCRFLAIGLDNSFQWLVPRWGVDKWAQFNWGAQLLGRYRVVPVWEPWEINPLSGATRDYYNHSWDVEKI